MCPKWPGHSCMFSPQVAHEYARSMEPSLGSFKPPSRGRCFASSYSGIRTMFTTQLVVQVTHHGLRVDDVSNTHLLDLRGIQQTKLDLLDTLQRRAGRREVKVRHVEGVGSRRSWAESALRRRARWGAALSDDNLAAADPTAASAFLLTLRPSCGTNVSSWCVGAMGDGPGTWQMETGALDALAARRRT